MNRIWMSKETDKKYTEHYNKIYPKNIKCWDLKPVQNPVNKIVLEVEKIP